MLLLSNEFFAFRLFGCPSSVNFVDSFPPRGSLDEGKIKTYPLSSAYADTFPATVGFFALFSLRRKSEKGESKG